MTLTQCTVTSFPLSSFYVLPHALRYLPIHRRGILSSAVVVHARRVPHAVVYSTRLVMFALHGSTFSCSSFVYVVLPCIVDHMKHGSCSYIEVFPVYRVRRSRSPLFAGYLHSMTSGEKNIYHH